MIFLRSLKAGEIVSEYWLRQLVFHVNLLMVMIFVACIEASVILMLLSSIATGECK